MVCVCEGVRVVRTEFEAVNWCVCVCDGVSGEGVCVVTVCVWVDGVSVERSHPSLLSPPPSPHLSGTGTARRPPHKDARRARQDHLPI